jgi:pectate lyase
MTYRTWTLLLALGAAAVAGCKATSSDGGGGGGKGTDATLSALVVTADDVPATLTPGFAGDAHAYSTVLRAGTQAVTVTATATDPKVSSLTLLQLGGAPTAMASGVATPVTLPAVGAGSALRVVVTAEDGVSTTGYTVVLSRRAAGTNATLASLTDSAGVLHFTGATSYTYTVSETQAVGYTITPTLTDPFASLTIDDVPAPSGTPTAIDLTASTATVTLVATSEDGNASTTYTLNITVPHVIPVTGISLARTQLKLGVNDTAVSLGATITPSNATDAAIAWTSSDPTTVQVDGSGNVTALKPGRQLQPVTITATTHDGGFQATAQVYALWFTDDFEDLATGNVTSIRKWNLLASTAAATANGQFSIATDGSAVLRYDVGAVGGVLATVADALWPAGITGDYYVEARIKPVNNTSNTSQKQLYLLGRYVDAVDWYAAGMNMQSTSRVEMNKMTSSTATAYPGASPSAWRFTSRNPGYTQFYTVRLELVGSTLSLYYDGELLTSTPVTDGTNPFTNGKIGLWTYNKSFEVDDVKVGDPSDKPVLLGITPAVSYAATVGDPDRVITVTAQRPNYTTGLYQADTFSATSDNPGVVSVHVSGSTVNLTPVGGGTANITFTSGSDPALTKTIQASISTFTMPTATYTLTGVTTPADNATGVNVDQRLSITFDAGSTPALGSGSVRIFRKSDNALVDVIMPTGEIDSLGYPGQSLVRKLNVSLLGVSGTTLTITPHHNALAYGTEYYVAIANGLVTGTVALNGTTWAGIGTAGDWSFTTKAAPATSLTSLTVDDDGTADFRTVQGALDYFMQNAALDTPVTVNVGAGTYPEPLYLRTKNNVSIIGANRDGTVIQYRNAESLNGGSGASQAPASLTPGGGRSLFLIEGSDLLTLQNLTMRNTFVRTSSGGQAEVLYFNNDTGRLVAKQATFLSEQDTLQVKGYSWFYQCLVAGNVDYIWGNNRVALFEESEIRTIGDSANSTSGWYVVQARTVTAADKGFVFLNSRLTHGPGPVTGDVTTSTYLARAQAGSWFDNVVYVNCNMDSHIMPAGWYTTPAPNTPPTQTEGWREYGSMDLLGNALDVSARATGIQLTPATVASGYANRTQILQGYNGGAGWSPTP